MKRAGITKVNAWAVKQRAYWPPELDDIFLTKKEARQYMKDCFEPEHEAEIIPVLITFPAEKNKKPA